MRLHRYGVLVDFGLRCINREDLGNRSREDRFSHLRESGLKGSTLSRGMYIITVFEHRYPNNEEL